jgi:hypothetical protein
MQLVSNVSVREETKISRMATKVTASANVPGARVLNRVAYDVRKVLVSVTTRRDGVPSEEEFVRMAIGESKSMGFKAGIALLSKEEWSEMYAYLRRLVTEG